MKEKKPLLILLIISILLIIIGFFVTNKNIPASQNGEGFWGDILKDVGLTILTLVIITFLWNLLGGDPVDRSITKIDKALFDLQSSVQLLEDSKKTGLQRILAVSGQFGSHTDWMDRLKSAEKKIDLLGYDLLVWTKGENFENEIINLINNGVEIRVLIMDEANPNLTAFMNTEQIRSITPNLIKENISTVKSFFSEIQSLLHEEKKNSLKIRSLKNGLIPLQLCRTDDRLTMVQYIYSEIASRSPILIIKGEESTLFKVYINEFEKLWKLAQ